MLGFALLILSHYFTPYNLLMLVLFMMNTSVYHSITNTNINILFSILANSACLGLLQVTEGTNFRNSTAFVAFDLSS